MASPAESPADGGKSLTGGAARLSLAQVIVFVGGLVSGPMLARALGATGRGHLASIIVPITILAWLASLGLGTWVTVEVARGRALGAVLGTTGLITTALGVVAAVATIPVAVALSGGNDDVVLFLFIGLALLPLTLCIQLLSSAAIGRSLWKVQARHRSVPAIVSLVFTATLFVIDQLTLATAAAVFLAGGLLSLGPLLPILREAQPLTFQRSLVKPSLRFGIQAWASNLGAITNARLDQLLMIPLVSARQLGLYAVAVTYAALVTILSAPMMTIVSPRIADGDHALIGRSLRVTLGLTTLTGLGLGIAAPIILPLAFGPEFRDTVGIAWVLLAAGVPLAGTVLLTAAMTSLGHPGTPALGQLGAAVVTVIGLFVLLPSMEAIGAALVSLIAYAAAFVFLLIATARHLQTAVTSLLTPKRSDLSWATALIRSMRGGRLRRRSP